MYGTGNISSLERVKAALEHREPDRIPLDIGSTKVSGISLMAYKNLLSYKNWSRMDENPELCDVTQQLATIKEPVLAGMRVDTRGLFPSAPSGWMPEYRKKGNYLQFTDEWGIGWQKPRDYGFYYDMVSHPMNGEITMKDAEDFSWPDPMDSMRTSLLQEQANEIAAIGEYAITMHGICSGVMEMALRLRGFEHFFMDLALNPEMAGSILESIVDIKIGYWDRALDLVGDKILVAVESDHLGTQESLLISPDLYRKYLKPEHTRLFSFIKKKSPHVKIFLHSCGAIKPLIPDLIEAGVDILNPVQVAARDMDTKQLKKDFGKDLVFWGGGIDTQRILPFGTPQEVREEVKKRIDDLAPGGGFVFNTVHNIQADVPPQNIEAMLEAVHEYGRY